LQIGHHRLLDSSVSTMPLAIDVVSTDMSAR